MAFWSEIVLQMVDEGKSNEEIIAHFNHRAVTEEYIKTAVQSRLHLHSVSCFKRGAYKHTQATPPAPNTMSRVVYDYMMTFPSREAFYHHVKHETTMAAVAQKLGLPPSAVANFMQNFFYPRGLSKYKQGYSNMAQRIKMQQLTAGTYKKKSKRLTTKAARELW
jgi:hypothetical protein